MIYFNWDVSCLMNLMQRLLDGDKYYYDVFECNLPMACYIYFIPVLFSKLFLLNHIISLRIYVFCIAALSLFLCHLLMNELFDNKDRTLHMLLLCILTFAFVLLPAEQFGQREHIMIMLIMPYLFLCSIRLTNKKTPNIYFAILIGLLAGIGFSIKPFFLFTLILIELYMLFTKRNFFAWLRAETLTIICVLIASIIAIFVFTPEYIFKIFPLAIDFAPATHAAPWTYTLTQMPVIFWLIALGMFLTIKTQLRYVKFGNILTIASIGLMLSYLIQDAYWYYHILPALTLTILLLTLIAYELSTSSLNTKWFNFGLNAFIIILLFLCPITYTVLHITSYINPETNEPGRILLLAQPIKKIAKGKYIYIFGKYSFPLIDYSQTKIKTRFADFRPLFNIIQKEPTANKTEKIKLNQEKQYIINSVIMDLQRSNPKLILFDTLKEKNLFAGQNFDYLKFFVQDARFRTIMKHYKYLKTIANTAFYIKIDQKK
jgi:hypothetical protein